MDALPNIKPLLVATNGDATCPYCLAPITVPTHEPFVGRHLCNHNQRIYALNGYAIMHVDAYLAAQGFGRALPPKYEGPTL